LREDVNIQQNAAPIASDQTAMFEIRRRAVDSQADAAAI